MRDTAMPKVNVQARIDPPLLERLDNWRRDQPDIPPRSQALRDLISRALAKEEPPRGSRRGSLPFSSEPGGDARVLDTSRVGGSTPSHSPSEDHDDDGTEPPR
jgi:hypothetical protein